MHFNNMLTPLCLDFLFFLLVPPLSLIFRHKKATASLNAGLDLKAAVLLPADEDLNEWLAVHVVDFFNRINLIYGP